ncbi:hypothetical protein HDU82_002489 [Entophlyctis luteolus]|nr:hypothetical protein HDU82_002489 [Entophlyctis luteolus]
MAPKAPVATTAASASQTAFDKPASAAGSLAASSNNARRTEKHASRKPAPKKTVTGSSMHKKDDDGELHSKFIGSTLLMQKPNSASDLNAVRVDSLIGGGSFSYVYLAHNIQVPNTEDDSSAQSETTSTKAEPLPEGRRAVKRLFKEGLDPKQLELQLREVTIMQDLGPHECIVPLIGTVEDDECLCLVMDYCEMDLYDAITKTGGFSDNAVKKIFAQIVDAVIHCHSKGIYHRDLKPENCLIVNASGSPSNYKIKITDFGLATSDSWSSEMGCGSVRYMAPECFDPNYVSSNPNLPKKKKFTPNPFSSTTGYPPAACDVWSLGVMLVNLLFAKNPWFEAHPSDAIFLAFAEKNPNILRQQFNLSPHFDSLLRRCFDLDPRRRCSVQDLKVLVETMPRFVGGSIPGLVIPSGPSRAALGELKAKSKHSGRGDSINTLGSTGSENTKSALAVSRTKQERVKPGLILPPGVKIPNQLDAEQIRQLLRQTSKASKRMSAVAIRSNSADESWLISSMPASKSLPGLWAEIIDAHVPPVPQVKESRPSSRQATISAKRMESQVASITSTPSATKIATARTSVTGPSKPMTPYIPSQYSSRFLNNSSQSSEVLKKRRSQQILPTTTSANINSGNAPPTAPTVTFKSLPRSFVTSPPANSVSFREDHHASSADVGESPNSAVSGTAASGPNSAAERTSSSTIESVSTILTVRQSKKAARHDMHSKLQQQQNLLLAKTGRFPSVRDRMAQSIKGLFGGGRKGEEMDYSFQGPADSPIAPEAAEHFGFGGDNTITSNSNNRNNNNSAKVGKGEGGSSKAFARAQLRTKASMKSLLGLVDDHNGDERKARARPLSTTSVTNSVSSLVSGGSKLSSASASTSSIEEQPVQADKQSNDAVAAEMGWTGLGGAGGILRKKFSQTFGDDVWNKGMSVRRVRSGGIGSWYKKKEQ